MFPFHLRGLTYLRGLLVGGEPVQIAEALRLAPGSQETHSNPWQLWGSDEDSAQVPRHSPYPVTSKVREDSYYCPQLGPRGGEKSCF